MGEDSITAAFRRFDADGNGQIERDELASVLKEIGPDTWNDAMIDQLFSNFDTSATAGIQYEDFVKWLVTIKSNTSESTFAQWASASVDEIVKEWGSWDVASLSVDTYYWRCDHDDSGEAHWLKLQADGRYEDYCQDGSGDYPDAVRSETGRYQIIRCLDATGDHLISLTPQHEKGEGCSIDTYKRDIEVPDRIAFLNRDLKTLRLASAHIYGEDWTPLSTADGQGKSILATDANGSPREYAIKDGASVPILA